VSATSGLEQKREDSIVFCRIPCAVCQGALATLAVFCQANFRLLRPVKLATRSRPLSNDPNFKPRPFSILEKVVLVSQYFWPLSFFRRQALCCSKYFERLNHQTLHALPFAGRRGSRTLRHRILCYGDGAVAVTLFIRPMRTNIEPQTWRTGLGELL
jgi:hypothetical protein